MAAGQPRQLTFYNDSTEASSPSNERGGVRRNNNNNDNSDAFASTLFNLDAVQEVAPRSVEAVGGGLAVFTAQALASRCSTKMQKALTIIYFVFVLTARAFLKSPASEKMNDTCRMMLEDVLALVPFAVAMIYLTRTHGPIGPKPPPSHTQTGTPVVQSREPREDTPPGPQDLKLYFFAM